MAFTLRPVWSYAASFYERPTLTKPTKIWCFTRYPYRVGLATTTLVFAGTLAVIALVFLLIGLITLGLFLIAAAISLGSLGGAIWLVIQSMRFVRPGKNGWAPPVITGAICYVILKPIWGFARGIWEAGAEFAGNLHYASVVTAFLASNWVKIGGFILFPVVAIFLMAGLTVGFNYLIRYFEHGFSWAYGIRYPCPVCSQKTEPAKYFCPNCRHAHAVSLLPNQYGVFTHRCELCNTALPTMMLLGRNKKIDHQCPHCAADLHSDALGTDKHIAFIGGQKSGKTCLLRQATRQLLEKGGKIPEPDQLSDQETAQRLMENGEAPPKTPPENKYRAFQIVLKKKPVPWHLHFYDLAGEKFEHSQDAAIHRFYATLDAVVFVFDPFCLPDFRSRHKLPPHFQAADIDPLDLVRNVTQVLEKYRSKEGTQKIAFHLLLVKTDTGYLDNIIHSNMEQTQQNLALKQFLINDLDQGALIHHIEHSFSKIQYLYTSALGRTPNVADRRPFESDNFEHAFRKIYASVGIKG